VLAVHPDHAGAASTEQAALVNAAGAILRQPETRAHYDALRAAWRAKHEGCECGDQPRRVNELEEQLAQARQERDLAQQHLAASEVQLERREVELAASETNRQRLQERLRSMTAQAWSQPSRWSWPRWVLGVLVGAAALSALLGSLGGTQVRLAPSLPPLMVPAPAAASVADQAADAEWSALLRDLDTTWEQDWPRTIAALEQFLARWPGYAAAQDKLYAALIADSQVHLQAGQVHEGVAELEQAARLLPERPEAWALLAQLATSAMP
jgi:hypothetical protein